MEGGNGQKLYACILGRSRSEVPTRDEVIMARQLLELQGEKWLELLDRMACNNFGVVYQECLNDVKIVPILIGHANYLTNCQEL